MLLYSTDWTGMDLPGFAWIVLKLNGGVACGCLTVWYLIINVTPWWLFKAACLYRGCTVLTHLSTGLFWTGVSFLAVPSGLVSWCAPGVGLVRGFLWRFRLSPLPCEIMQRIGLVSVLAHLFRHQCGRCVESCAGSQPGDEVARLRGIVVTR